jgi:hypothetical protein
VNTPEGQRVLEENARKLKAVEASDGNVQLFPVVRKRGRAGHHRVRPLCDSD